MLTRQELARLERSLRGQKVLSVYLDGAATDPAAHDDWRRELARLVTHERDVLRAAPHAEREAFERCVVRLEEELAALPGALRATGWVGLFPAHGEAYVEALPVPMPTLLAWDDGARVAPYVRALKQHRPAIVAIVDSGKATIHVYVHDELEVVGTMHAQPSGEEAVHMGYPPSVGFHTGTRGSAGADAADRERLVLAERLRHELARQLDVLAGTRAWVLVGGIPEMVSAVVDAIPDHLQARVQRLAHLDVHATEAQIRDAAEHATTTASRDHELALVLRAFDVFAAGGRAAIGPVATREALAARAVLSLFLTRAYLAREPRDAEALVRMALEQSADVEHVSGEAAERLDEAGGVGAILRFVPPRIDPPRGETPRAGSERVGA